MGDTAKGDVHIIKTGRLFGVTEKNDDYLMIEASVLKTGQKIISVKVSDPNDKSALKSSAPSTGAPFVNVQKLCRMWFGDNQDNWKRDLKLLETVDGIDYYEITETNDAGE